MSRTNKYPAHCVRCGQNVPAGEGECFHNGKGWRTNHAPGQCPPKPPKPSASAKPRARSHDVDERCMARVDGRRCCADVVWFDGPRALEGVCRAHMRNAQDAQLELFIDRDMANRALYAPIG